MEFLRSIFANIPAPVWSAAISFFRRLFKLMFWVLVIVLLVWSGSFYKVGEKIDNVERVLLDMRLKARAETLSPSDDIVIVAMDKQTETYARNHPEMGLKGNALPRGRLAQIINYLSAQKAKAIILDVEFRNATDEENDLALERAIRNAGNVYLGAYAATSLAEENFAFNMDDADHKYKVYQAAFLPLLKYKTLVDTVLFSAKGSSYIDLGYVPLFPISDVFLSGLIDDNRMIGAQLREYRDTKHVLDNLNGIMPTLYESFPKSLMSHAATYPMPLDPAGIGAYQANDCLVTRYRQNYFNSPEFLSLLETKGVNVRYLQPPQPETERGLSYCYISLVQERFLRESKGLGITSVKYDEDSYIREIRPLFKGYKHNFYTYLGVLPSLEAQGVKVLDYTPSSLDFLDRRVNLISGEKFLINWRNPMLGVDKMLRKAELEMTRDSLGYIATALSFVETKLGRRFSSYEDAAAFLPAHLDANMVRELWPLILEYKGARDLATSVGLRLFPWESERLRDVMEESELALLGARVGRQLLTGDVDKPFEGSSYLGWGHLYRLVSAIDILRKVENREGDTDIPSLFRVHGAPWSGPFSFKDKIVIYGDTIKDLHPTPVADKIFGPEIVATVIDMMLHDYKFVQKAPHWQVYLLIGLIALGIFQAAVRFPRLAYGFTSGLLLIILFWIYNFWVFIANASWVPIVTPTLLLVLALMISTVYKYYVQDREKRQLTQVFSNYVSPQVLDEILTDPDKALDNLRGSKKELTVLFADIKSFTHKFENEDPELMVEQLNEYFDVMINVILSHNGTIDKYMGDAIMAFFGAPHHFDDHAEKACEAALEMFAALQVLNRKWAEEGKTVFEHGIGVSTGLMFVGNFGSQKIKDFTVMGSLVNLGSRLEAYTREVNAEIIISENTYRQLGPDANVRDLGKINVKGFTEPVQVYALKGIGENRN